MKVIVSFLFFLVLFSGYFFLFAGAYYSHPNAEDFSLTAAPMNKGILVSIEELLINYDGRYFTNFLHGINPMALGWLEGYKWTIIFGIVFPVFSLFYFFTSFIKSASNIKVLSFCTLLMLIQYALTPSIVHQVYWMVSSFVYHYSWCFWLLWVGSFIRFYIAPSSPKKDFYYLLAAFLMICSIGMNEMFLVLNILTLFSIGIYLHRIQSEQIKTIIPFFLKGLIAVGFFISNPGILERFASFEQERSKNHGFEIFPKSVLDFSTEILRWNTEGGLLILFLLFVFLNFPKHYLFFCKQSLKTVLFLFFAGLIALYFMLLAFYVPMGYEEVLPLRVFTSVLLGYILLLTTAIIYLKNKYQYLLDSFLTPFRKNFISVCVMLMLFFSIMFSGNNIKLIKKEFFDGTLVAYNESMYERYELIQTTDRNNDKCLTIVWLPPLTVLPESVFYPPEIAVNRQEPYWNKAYQSYFNIDEVRLTGDSIFMKHHLKNISKN